LTGWHSLGKISSALRDQSSTTTASASVIGADLYPE
jgi:hypothetical protein